MIDLTARMRRSLSGPIARGSITSFAIRLAGVGAIFLQTIVLAQLLGIEGYGRLALGMSVANVLTSFATIGLGAFAVREIPRLLTIGDEAGAKRFSTFALLVTLMASLTAASLLLSLSASLSIPGAASLLVVPLALLLALRGIAQGNYRMALAQLPGDVVRPVFAVVALGALALLSRFELSPDSALIVLASGAMVAASCALVLARNLLARGLTDERRFMWLSGSTSFMGAGALYLMQTEIVTLELGWLSGPDETGLLQPALQFAPLFMLPVTAAQAAYAPRVASLWEQCQNEHVAQVTTLFARSTTLACTAIALIMGIAVPILPMLLGEGFGQIAPLVWIVAIGQLFNSICGPCATLLAMAGRNSTALRGVALSVGVQAICGLLLIPQLGALGGAITFAVGVVVLNISLWVAARSLLGIDTSVFGLRPITRTDGQ